MKTTFFVLIFFICTGHLLAQSLDERMQNWETSQAWESSGNYAKALSAIESVYINDSYADNMRMGWLNYLKGEYNISTGFYEKAIKLKPESVEARLGYVLPLSVMENWEEVIRQYQAILESDPHNTTANYRLAYIYYYRENYTKAVNYLNDLLSLYPLDFDGLSLMGWTKLAIGDKESAIEYFGRALMVTPGDETTLDGLKMARK